MLQVWDTKFKDGWQVTQRKPVTKSSERGQTQNSVDKSHKGNLWQGVQKDVKTQYWQVAQRKPVTGSERSQNSVLTSHTKETSDREFR